MRSFGFRRGTRNTISKGFKEHGKPHVGKILQQFRVGDLVDCRIDASIVKGMPHKYYHGKTGVVFNCNPRSYGVTFQRRVGGKYIEKSMHIRVEHLNASRSDEDSKRRYAEYAKQLAEAREKGVKIQPTKRQPVGPKPAFTLVRNNQKIVEIAEKPYVALF